MSKTVASVVQGYLQTVQTAVNQITNPATGQPVQIPDFDTLNTAAGAIDTATNPTEVMYLIQSLLGRANCVDFAVPTTIDLPADHHMHPTMGVEWYWIASHLNVTDQAGNKGRISVLTDMTRNRTVGLAAQKAAGWSDEQVTIANTVTTVTVDMGPGKRDIYRRSTNAQWPALGGTVKFSVPGESFSFQCGNDSLSGTANVLPLNVIIDDGTNMQLNMTFTNQTSLKVETAYFQQGVPIIGGNGGNGITPVPTPGIYYSWPQLLVSGSVTAGGNTYTIDSGTGWIDHEIMMASLENVPTKADPNGVHPLPFVEDPAPYNGWVWQFYNFDNGMALTGAGFITDEMNLTPAMSYGYFLQPDGNGGWTAIYVNGDIDLLWPNVFPVNCDDPTSEPVMIPIVRAYSNVENELLGHPLSGVATPWYNDGTFNFPNLTLCSESPADYTDMSGQYANGLGYLESVGFQKVADYRANALAILQNQ